ncbi:MAG: hypothetical protein GXX79_21635 [Actinomycetales bacterium]|nr:hypothetical protein [Actinomycetales bacterium]
MASRRRLAVVATGTALAVALGLLGAVPASGAGKGSGSGAKGEAPKIPGTTVYPARKVASRAVTPRRPAADVPAAAWPRAGRVEVPVRTGTAGASRKAAADRAVRAGQAPVWARATKTTAAGGTLDVAVLPRSAAAQAGTTGLVLQVSAGEDTGQVAGEKLQVGLDYSAFADAFGGDWATRLRVVALPACAVTTPQRAECRRRTPVTMTNDPVSGQLEATITVPPAGSVTPAPVGEASAQVSPATAAGSAGISNAAMSSTVAASGVVKAAAATGQAAAVTLAVEAGPSGGAGDYSATSLSPSAAWSAGGNTGGFSWSYPLRVPPAPGGPSPELGFSYSSESVDGKTSSTNNQTSWLGEGFGLESGFVERKYVSCAEDMKDGANNTVKSGDLCWRTDNATLVLGDRSSELVLDSATKKWRFEEDDGSKIERFTGMTNGDNDGEYWRLTTPDGTRYYFGRGKRYAADTINTQSTLTVPVAGNHTGEPGHATAFKDSFLTQAWRWNVDYVVDVHGNSMTYLYGRETNRYRQSDAKKSVAYHRAGYLKQIEYGERKGSEATTDAPAQVTFTTAERCIPTSDFDCAASKMVANPSKWPDTPVDQVCTNTTQCKLTQGGPTFFTTKRLTRVYTEILNAADGSYPDVDSWKLTQSFPRTGDGLSPALWLDTITHTGAVGTSVAMPPVTITGDELPNRVEGTDGGPLLYKRRVGSILTETGGQISVSYAKAECTASALPSPASNTKRCFPSYWTPTDGSVSGGELLGWFHKYPVTQVVESDLVAGGADKVTRYEYLGGGAWHYDDNELTKPSRRTFSEWRGFAKVRVRTGDSATPNTLSESTFLRGMHGDGKPGGTKKSVTVTDSQGGEVVDRDRWKSFLLESVTYDGVNGSSPGKEVEATINVPWISAATATDGTRSAYLMGTSAVKTRTRLADGTYRSTQTSTTFDTTYGMATQTDDFGGTDTAADNRCTRYTYNRNTSLGIIDKVARTETVAVKCSATPDRSKDVISDVRSYFDGATSLTTAPTRGLVTRTERLATHDGTTATYETVGTSTYDSSGRVTSVTDGAGRVSKTAYAPAAPALVTTVTTTNPKGFVATSTLNPAWGLATATTDANGNLTELRYDGLGRLIRVYDTDRSRADGESPTTKYTYTVSRTAPSVVKTETLNNGREYTDSYLIYDGLLRTRQVQSHAASSYSDRVVKETVYDSRGLVVDERGPFAVAGAPSGTLLAPPSPVPVQAQTTYDGAGRAVAVVTKVDGVEKWRTTTSYGGDRVSTDPPEGETPTTSITDARGQLVELRQYHGSSPTGSYDKTSYTYTPAGKQATITGPPSQAAPDGAVWSYRYDQRGRLVKTVDPDAGTSEITAYNGADQPVTTKSPRGVIWRQYDAMGRITQTRKDSSTGTLLTSSTYDTLTAGKGLLTSTTRYTSGQAYTTSVNAYDEKGRATSSSITIPAAEGKLAGTYTTAKIFALDGNVGELTYPAIGDLPREFLHHGYSRLGLLGDLSSTQTGALAMVTRTPYGEAAQLAMLRSDDVAWQTFTYEEGTRRLERMQLIRHQQTTTDADLAYTYDPAGNITRIADTPGQGTGETQCFRYDHLRRLTEAWTAGDACASAPKRPSDGGSALAGPAPYWNTYSYDPAGNRTTETVHGTGGDTTRSYAYGKSDGTQPDTLTSVSQTGTAGARTDTFTYDTAGSTTQRVVAGKTQNLTWDIEGHVATITEGSKTTSFVYDASGNRLLRKDPTATTLYLDGQELRLDKTTDTLAATRYYAFDGTTLAVRNAAGYKYIVGDQQGTGQWQIAEQTRTLTRRRTTPFGTDRGTPTGTWTGEKGFVGGTIDATTGLTHLGAREYDPALGRFISIDPVFDQTDPKSWNGYAYADSNPVVFSDPDGLNCHSAESCAAYEKTRKKTGEWGAGIHGYGETPGQQAQRHAYSQARTQFTGMGPAKVSAWNRLKGAASSAHKKTVTWVNDHRGTLQTVQGVAAGIGTIAEGVAVACAASIIGNLGCSEAALAVSNATNVVSVAAGAAIAYGSCSTGAPSCKTDIALVAADLAIGGGAAVASARLSQRAAARVAPNVAGTVSNGAIDAVSALRSSGTVGAKRNIAAAEVSIEGGDSYVAASVSGVAERMGTVSNVGTKGNPQRFIPTATGGNSRFYDSEYKLLNHVANRLGPSSSKVTGSINLHSELPVCASCSSVVGQFQQAFPGIRINITTG